MIERAVIDLSHWNTVTSLQAVKDSGVLGVIAKCTEATASDPAYAGYKAGALAAGLLFGAYHFIRPGSAILQAKNFVQRSEGAALLALDYEDNNVPISDVLLFLNTVYDLTGKRAVLYSGNTLKEKCAKPDPILDLHRLWLAQYTSGACTLPATHRAWWLWQYTEKGAVPGIKGYVDISRFSGTAQQLREQWC